MTTKRTRNLAPTNEAPMPPLLPAPTQHGQDDYQQLLLAVQDYFSANAIGFRDLGGRWSVSHEGKREMFYGAGDAFSHAVGLLDKHE